MDTNARTSPLRSLRRPTIALLLAVGALAGCSKPGPSAEPVGTSPTTSSPASSSPAAPDTTATSSTTAAVADIRGVDFRSFTFPADSCPTGGFADPPAGGFPLREGLFRDASGHAVNLNEGMVVYGDLTGDGRDDAVVPLTCSTGTGSGTITHPWVFASDAGSAGGARRLPYPGISAAQLGALGLDGHFPKGASPKVEGGTLVIEWSVIVSPVEPGKEVTTRQRWTGSAWETAAPTTVQDPPANP